MSWLVILLVWLVFNTCDLCSRFAKPLMRVQLGVEAL